MVSFREVYDRYTHFLKFHPTIQSWNEGNSNEYCMLEVTSEINVRHKNHVGDFFTLLLPIF